MVVLAEAVSPLKKMTTFGTIFGEELPDRLVPPENAKLIAERIPGAKLAMIPRASHIFLTDQTEAAHQAILEFLGGQATRNRERPAPV